VIDRYVRFSRRWRWPITAAWLVALVIGGAVSAELPSLLSGGGWAVEGSDSAAVEKALQDGFVGRGRSNVTVVVHDGWYTQDQPGFASRVNEVFREVADNPELKVDSRVGWATLTTEAREAYLGDDKRTAIEVMGLGLEDGRARLVLPEVQTELVDTYARQGLDVSLVSTASFWGEVNRLSEEGLAHAELITLPLILLVLLLLFGGVVAAVTSLSVGITSILFTFAVLTVLARDYELSVFVQNTATMLGLGVGVDYSLFVIARFKEELASGKTVDAAVAATLRTSGETVLFSGITIVAAMSTLFLVPLGVIASIALGAIVVVAFSILVSLLLLPVLLQLLGHRISRGVVLKARGTHREPSSARWETLTSRIMRRPVLFLGGGLAIMLALAAPALALTTFTPDAQIIPTSSPVRAGFDRMQDQFGVGSTTPIQVLVLSREALTGGAAGGKAAADAVIELRDTLAGLESTARVDSALDVLAQVSPDDPLAALAPDKRAALPPDAQAVIGHYVSDDARSLVLDVVPEGHASDGSTQDLLAATRTAAAGIGAGLTATVGGETAQGVESNQVIQDALPRVVLTMLAVIYLLLLLTFRSLLLPLKAIAMNLVSVGATFGVLVVVFQGGLGGGLLGFEETGYIQNFVPVLLLTLLFSLSTDYEVFLLNRVREDYLESGDNTRSVARGLASTAPLISGAALLMVVVFGAFAFAGILPIKQLGFGMAVAIAIDATIVRLILVPAAMRLMGAWNWWLPGRGTRAVPAPTARVRVPASSKVAQG